MEDVHGELPVAVSLLHGTGRWSWGVQAPRTQPWALPGIEDIAGTMSRVLVAAPMPA